MVIRSYYLPIITLAAYFLTSSLYIMPSGLPQPSDIIVALFMFPWAFFYIHRIPVIARLFVLLFLLFVFWASIVSLLNALYLQKTGTLLPIAWYVYNFLFVLGLATLAGSLSYERYFSILKKILFFSVVFAFILFMTMLDYGIRFTGQFNNPNQVGYFGLLLFCNVIIVAWATDNISIYHKITLLLSGILCLMSFSLSATGALLIAFVGLLLLFFKKSRFNTKNSLSFLFFLFVLSSLIVFFSTIDLDNRILINWETRIGAIERKIEGLVTDRGYDRIIEYPEYIFFGAAEGEEWRFAEHSNTLEIHSTLGTVVFSYGIIGTILFLLILGFALWSAPLGLWLVITAPLGYGLTHQGMRQPMFWMLLFITIYAVKVKPSSTPKSFNKHNRW